MPIGSQTPAKRSDQYLRTAWTTEDDLPQNSVNAIVQSRDGYLWLVTFGGLARLDGVRFTLFGSASSPELRRSRIVSLYSYAAAGDRRSAAYDTALRRPSKPLMDRLADGGEEG